MLKFPIGPPGVVVVVTRVQRGGTTDLEIVDYPVFDISVDHEDGDIVLLTDEDSKSARPASEALTVESLLNRLRKLELDMEDYTVWSGSAFVPLGAEWEGSVEATLVGVIRNNEAQIFGFMQGPRELWEA